MTSARFAVLCAALAGGSIAVSSAAHAVDAAILEASAGLHTLPSLVAHGSGERDVRINGATLRLESGHEHTTLSAWLTATQRACEGRASQPMPSAGAPERAFWLEVHDADSALAGCLVGPGLAAVPDELLAQVRDFARELDLGQLGELRVLRAQRAGPGLHVVSVRSAGALPLVRMFPRHGDAPGAELPRLPRPPDARRVLSAYEDGRAPGLAVYARPGSAESLLQAEASRLGEAGFEAVAGAAGRAFVRGDELVFLAARARGSEALLMVLSPGLGPLSVRVAAAVAHESSQPRASAHR